jgi:hypothetical protein
VQLAMPINFAPDSGMASGSYGLVLDGGVGLNFTGVLLNFQGNGGQMVRAVLDARLINRNPSVPPNLPLSGTFETLPPNPVVFPRSFFRLDCDAMGANCAVDFISTSGAYNITAATAAPAAGVFVGSFTNTRYDEVDLMAGRYVPDGGCVEVAGFNFAAAWP